ncbi:metal ABC transporter solute-binding protein, Zn/Mn family [Lacticaseibacillus mingshuiensis]|uniref:Metal ABC transporter solute-binding protein, Zn/Mn family n=1 Tax=Lacticaseibacillus mingshuiensis TaxID=2799574 RepID=A0ABW4CGZ6_9LACO
MLKHFIRWALVLVAIFTFGLALSACSSSSSAYNTGKKQLSVVATVDFYGEVAKAVLGSHGHVTSIITKPEIDPHDYEPTTAVGKTVAEADIALANGAGYDSWMDKLVKASGKAKLITAAQIVGVKDGENEHIWYKPDAMPKIANALAKDFAKRDPANKAAYQKNAAAYIKKLQPVTDLIAKLKQGANGQRVAVSEPVFNNALSAMGYTVSDEHFANAIEDDNDPSPADLAALKTDIKNKKIAFFVRNIQVDSKLVSELAAECKQAGVPVLEVTETLPAGMTYVTWMSQQYQQLAKLLK